MKKLMIYLTVAALILVVASPAPAQTVQEDQYPGPELTCDNYEQFEVPPPDLVEECSGQNPLTNPTGLPSECDGPSPDPFLCGLEDARDAIPEAGNSSNQTFEGFSNALSELKSDESNESEAVAAELDKPAEKSNEVSNKGASEAKDERDRPKKEVPKEAGDEDSPKNEEEFEVEKSLGGVAELPETGGSATLLLGASVLLLAGGLTMFRLFR